MTYPVSPSDLDSLQRSHQSLRYDVGELESKAETFAEQLRDIETEQSLAEERLREELGTLQRDLREDLDEIQEAVKTVAGQIGWIERQVRANGDLQPVDLDAVDDIVRALVQRAETGRTSQDVLLGDADRAGHQRVIALHQALCQRIETGTDTALQHGRTLAEAEHGSSQFTKAKHAYRQTRTLLARDRQQLATAERNAQAARQALHRDDELRAEHGPKVMTGTAARETLDGRLRQRISTALAQGALMPVWFSTVLGYQPPAQQTEQWITTAASLLAYRLTYVITDQVVALGPPIRPDGSRRAEWYRELEQQTRRLRRWP